jgi:hypothetical protein
MPALLIFFVYRIDLKDFVGTVEVEGAISGLSIGHKPNGSDMTPFYSFRFETRTQPRYLFNELPFKVRGHKSDALAYDSELIA